MSEAKHTPTPDAHSGVQDDAVEAAAIAIDRLWSEDGTNREYPFPETEQSYQQHCRSTARAALHAAHSEVRVKAKPVGWETEAEWALEQRAFQWNSDWPLEDTRELINDLWRQYCLAAEPKQGSMVAQPP